MFFLNTCYALDHATFKLILILYNSLLCQWHQPFLNLSKNSAQPTVTYNKKYIFDIHPSSWYKTPKIFRFSCDESNKSGFCYVDEWLLESTWGWGRLPVELTVWLVDWKFQSPSPFPLEKEMAIHSSTLAWKIPWTEEPGMLQSMGSQRIGHDWALSLALFILMMCLQ